MVPPQKFWDLSGYPELRLHPHEILYHPTQIFLEAW